MATIPEKYKEVFSMFNITLKTLEEHFFKNGCFDDVYYHLKKHILIAFEKCYTNECYCDSWYLWFKKTKSTILLRELFSDINCNYWSNLINSNAIDTLDSLQNEITIKINKCNEKT